MKRQKSHGICQLTKRPGRFVDAHLIPKALTRPAAPGLPFVESGPGKRPARRWSSWYDNQLVTVEGEAILAELDSWAIAQLRKHQLVWSGWGPIQSLSGDHDRIGDTGFGLRKVTNIDGKKLRLFFLSLLWRAAASSHPGFSEVTVETEDLEKLRIMLLAGDAGSPSYFSIQLTQISTLGPSQNLAPLARIKTIPAYEDVPEKLVPYFRFYFDGLAAHIHRQDNDDAKELGAMVVGQTDTLALTTVTYAESFQRKNLGLLMAEAYRDWPELMTKL